MSDEVMISPPGPNDKVGFRDIYQAVGASEARIIDALNRALAPLIRDRDDHEQRLRMIETLGSPEAREALNRISAIEAQVQPLASLSSERDRRLGSAETVANAARDDIAAFKNRENGVLGTLGFGKAIVIILAAGMGIALGLMDLISRLST